MMPSSSLSTSTRSTRNNNAQQNSSSSNQIHDTNTNNLSSASSSVSRLTSLLPSTGGGLQPKKITTHRSSISPSNQSNGKSIVLPDPSAGKSMLGLDRLAAVKRLEREQLQQGGGGGNHPSSVNHHRPNRDDVDSSSSNNNNLINSNSKQNHRSYRNTRDANETPSHPGGLNREAYQRVQRQHHQHGRHHHQQQHQQGRQRNNPRGDDGESDDNRHGGDDSDYNRNSKRSRDDDDDNGDVSRRYDKRRHGGGYDRDDNRQYRSTQQDRGSRRHGERSENRYINEGNEVPQGSNPGRDYHDDRRNNSNGRGRTDEDSRYNRNNIKNNNNFRQGSMPPPSARRPTVDPPPVTPSTNASNSTMRQRRNESVHAATPLLGGSSSVGMANSSQPTNRNGSTSRNYRNSRSDDWDIETPLHGPRDDGDPQTSSSIRSTTDTTGIARQDDDSDFDRQFYLDEQEDGGYLIDQSDDKDLGRFLFENSKTKQRETEMEQKRQQRQQQPQQQRFNARQSALQDDQEAWEENRLLSSGAAVRSAVDVDNANINEQDMSRVTLLVHQTKPPFLDGRVSFSTVREAVPTVKDASSDFAKMAREGSATLRYLRANKDKNSMRQKFWELGGTRMGDAVGIKKEGEDNSESDSAQKDDDGNGEIDYKKATGFAQHMKKTTNNGEDDANGPVSAFARTKTIRQQREYLPVFSVREGLLNVIRENNCVVIVGETGSGKVRDDLLVCAEGA
jgi:pre-mRNA-splicing factor ATP-dependent RNA helicase DHX38/PRP16